MFRQPLTNQIEREKFCLVHSDVSVNAGYIDNLITKFKPFHSKKIEVVDRQGFLLKKFYSRKIFFKKEELITSIPTSHFCISISITKTKEVENLIIINFR